MSGVQKKRRRVGWGACIGVAVIAGGAAAHAGVVRPTQTSGRPTAVDAYERMTGDVTIRHGRVDAQGHSARALVPTSVLHLERQRHNGRWRTALTLRAEAPRIAQSPTGPETLDNPFGVTRFEYDEDGTPPRIYNRAGTLIAPPDAAARKALGVPAHLQNPDWRANDVLSRVGTPPALVADRGPAAGLLVRARDSGARRASIERTFGRRADQVRGLDRFVVQDHGLVRELLADPQTALPVEVNVARAGRLISHSTLAFHPLPNGDMIRRLLRSEQVASATDDSRIVMEIELGNVSFGKAGSQ